MASTIPGLEKNPKNSFFKAKHFFQRSFKTRVNIFLAPIRSSQSLALSFGLFKRTAAAAQCDRTHENTKVAQKSSRRPKLKPNCNTREWKKWPKGLQSCPRWFQIDPMWSPCSCRNQTNVARSLCLLLLLTIGTQEVPKAKPRSSF